MRRLPFAVVALSLVGACSSAQEDVRPAKRPEPAPTAEPKPRPPRALDGQPVVLALRKATPMRGVDWTWLMPEGRLVALAPPTASGDRMIIGPNFFAGPNGLMVGLDGTGAFTLAADAQTHPLGKYDGAAFDAKGERTLVWNSAGWSLVRRDGTRARSEEMARSRPVLLPDGTVVATFGVGNTIVIAPDGSTRVTLPYACEEIFPAARRLVCSERPWMAARTVRVFSFERTDELAKVTAGSQGDLTFAVRADGGSIAVASEKTIEVFDIEAGKKAKSHVAFRRDRDLAWRRPRMAFTPDGKRLCVEEADATRVIDPEGSEFKNGLVPKPPKGEPKSRALCLFAQRSAEPAGPGTIGRSREWEGRIVDVAAHPGFNLLPRVLPQMQGIPTEAISADQRTGVVLEYKLIEEADQLRWTERAVVFDVATGAEKRIVELGEHKGAKYQSPDVPRVELSGDGKNLYVCAARMFSDGCRRYSAETGEVATNGEYWSEPRQVARLTIWSGNLPEVAIGDVLAALSVPVEAKAKVVSWSDEGKYVSIEMDPGDGATVRLNMPDSAEHVVRDVQSVAGGAMLAFASQGLVELWKVQPLELTAVLVGVPDGGAAMFTDGSVETVGKGADALGCQKGEMVAPIDRCGDVWAEKGTLLALMKSAKNQR